MKLHIVGISIMVFVLVSGLVFSFIFLNASFDQTSHLSSKECIEVNKVASLVYDLCYDAYSQSIFMDVRRGEDTYRLTELQLSFFDSANRDYVIKEVPAAGSMKSYQIASPKNPTNIDVRLGIVKDFSSPICETPRQLFVEYCPSRGSNASFNAKLNPLNGASNDNNIVLGSLPEGGSDSDLLSESLVDKEAAWKVQCESEWKCSDWETCYNGVQKRFCEDIKGCQIPTDAPPTNRECGATCSEDWECSWSACQNGHTTPTCIDKNNCGTVFDLPKKLSCGSSAISDGCSPNIVCGQWNACEVNYDFLDLSGNSILDLKGERSRTCIDLNSCIPSVSETTSCSTKLDVRTEQIVRCGQTYRGIYNILTNELIAKIRMGSEDDVSLDITLTSEDEEYCDYCYDGVKNGDEEGIDCGGSCMSCTDKYGPAYKEVYAKNSALVLPQNLIASLLNLDRQGLLLYKPFV